jgi:hypothetical protein
MTQRSAQRLHGCGRDGDPRQPIIHVGHREAHRQVGENVERDLVLVTAHPAAAVKQQRDGHGIPRPARQIEIELSVPAAHRQIKQVRLDPIMGGDQDGRVDRAGRTNLRPGLRPANGTGSQHDQRDAAGQGRVR